MIRGSNTGNRRGSSTAKALEGGPTSTMSRLCPEPGTGPIPVAAFHVCLWGGMELGQGLLVLSLGSPPLLEVLNPQGFHPGMLGRVQLVVMAVRLPEGITSGRVQ